MYPVNRYIVTIIITDSFSNYIMLWFLHHGCFCEFIISEFCSLFIYLCDLSVIRSQASREPVLYQQFGLMVAA